MQVELLHEVSGAAPLSQWSCSIKSVVLLHQIKGATLLSQRSYSTKLVELLHQATEVLQVVP